VVLDPRCSVLALHLRNSALRRVLSDLGASLRCPQPPPYRRMVKYGPKGTRPRYPGMGGVQWSASRTPEYTVPDIGCVEYASRTTVRESEQSPSLIASDTLAHMPGGRWYDRTVITVSKREQWFCSEGEAKAAGWRRAGAKAFTVPRAERSPSITEPVKACCKVCRKSKACGNSCISRRYTCRKPPGCACDG